MKPPTSNTLIKIVKILSDGAYHNGNSMGAALNITRTAVWKAIKKLVEYGIQIESIKGQGYLLLEPLILLEKKSIQKQLATKKMAFAILETVASTNDYLKNKIKSLPMRQQKQPWVCLAEQQTRGRGRFQRHWHSPFAQNIYFSMAYSFEKDISELAGLGMIVALSLLKTIESFALLPAPCIKWPNDIIVNHKKLAGVLIDVEAETHVACHVIIGIGMNVNMLQAKEQVVGQAWESLRHLTNKYIDRNELVANITQHLLGYLAQFEKKGFTSFLNSWKRADYLYDHTITIKSGTQKITGVAKGINHQGHLLLELNDGRIQGFSSGDTSVVREE